MSLFMKFMAPSLLGFVWTSVIAAIIRVHILDLGCDPKFECLCSISCLLQPILFSTSIFGLAFILAYLAMAHTRSL